MKRIWLIAAALVLVAAHAFAERARPDLSGIWKGQGQFIADGQAKDIRCRLTIAASRPNVMAIDGRCAAPAGAQDLRFAIELGDDGAARTLALSDAPAGQDEPELTGRWTQNEIRLWHEDGARVIILEIERITADHLRLSAQQRRGGSSETLIMQMRK